MYLSILHKFMICCILFYLCYTNMSNKHFLIPTFTRLISSAAHSSAIVEDRLRETSGAACAKFIFVPMTSIGTEVSANCSGSYLSEHDKNTIFI